MYPKNSNECISGVEMFLNFAFRTVTMDIDDDDDPKISCPPAKCVNRYWFTRKAVYDHLTVNRFYNKYKVWNFHGEGLTTG